MSFHAKLVAGAAILVVAGPCAALAQAAPTGMPMLPQVQPQAPQAPQPVMFGSNPGEPGQAFNPAMGLPRPANASLPTATMPRPAAPPEARDPNAGAAPLPKMGDGGFGTLPPTPGKEDVADRMNLTGADAYVKTLSGAASGQLDNMVKGAVPSLDAATVPNQGDLTELEQTQRDIQVLESKARKAEAAVKLWGIVYDNEHAKAWREEEKKKAEAEEKRKKEEAEAADKKAQLDALLAQARGGQQPGQGGQAGGIRMMAPSLPAPLVYEVVNGRASLIVNGGLVRNARAGTSLPDGSTVTDVRGGSVTAKVNGKPVTLGYYSAPVGKN